jgi:aminoglycoside 3-N-acetyltransferase
MTEQQAASALRAILDTLGVQAGDRIMLGIDMGKLPLPRYPAALNRAAFRARERQWCQFVLDVLLERLGPQGTLLAPAFSYSCTRPGSVFVAESTPAENGPFTDFLRADPRAVRSLHPIFSIAGIGRDAHALLDDVGHAAFGAMSPFARFAGHGIRFLGLGLELRVCLTHIHHLEQQYGCPHRFHKTFDVTVQAGGRQISGDWHAYMGFRGIDYASDVGPLMRALDTDGLLRKVDANGGHHQLAEIADVERLGYALLSDNALALVDRPLRMRFEDGDNPGGPGARTSRMTAVAVDLDTKEAA